MSFKEHVAADISAHAGAHLNVVESQAKVNAGQRLDKERTLEESEAQMGFKLTIWRAQEIAKHNA
eukprot:133646-Pyramimonas_sp.AAC.1